jgi:hypothetical protein
MSGDGVRHTLVEVSRPGSLPLSPPRQRNMEDGRLPAATVQLKPAT